MTEKSDVSLYVPIADRLNPKRSGFDSLFKERWLKLSKNGRSKLLKQDRQAIKALKERAASIVHPFSVDDDDHCETGPDAYKHAVPLLNLLAARLGKEPGDLRVYDPYFCAGAVKSHLKELGFPNVYNECEDFYKVQAEGKGPAHDVLLTNPPYSGEHMSKLLSFVAKNSKPFLLLMPTYVANESYYLPSLLGREERAECKLTEGTEKILIRGKKRIAAWHRQRERLTVQRKKQRVSNTNVEAGEKRGSTEKRRDPPLFVCPKKRYLYWTPHGLRSEQASGKKAKGHTSSHTSATLGTRTSPFPTVWYSDLNPVVSHKELLDAWPSLLAEVKTDESEVRVCASFSDLPASGWEAAGGQYKAKTAAVEGADVDPELVGMNAKQKRKAKRDKAAAAVATAAAEAAAGGGRYRMVSIAK
jgi:hypothetical protein